MSSINLFSKIHHDKDNDRIYLTYLDPRDFPTIVHAVESLADENSYSKIFAKVPAKYSSLFFLAGFKTEAFIPKFFKGQEDVLFLSKFKDNQRSVPEHQAMMDFQNLVTQPIPSFNHSLAKQYSLRPLSVNDIPQMIEVFKQVFDSYPFPIFDPIFLRSEMDQQSTLYFGTFYENHLVAISSAEMDTYAQAAEMTDFAVLPAHRGKSLATIMLSYMESSLKNTGTQTFFTIARLLSYSMNKAFHRSGYKYSGTLIKNTQISGKIESMNVWYKNV
jgi:beta-lysine N6-acetyltransferase